MSVYSAVSFSCEAHELSIGSRKGYTRIVQNKIIREIGEIQRMHHGDHNVLGEAAEYLVGNHRKERNLIGLHVHARPSDGCRCMHGIGVGKQKDLSGGGLRELIARPRLADPSLWQGLSGDHGEGGKLTLKTREDLRCRIRGTIVEYDDFRVSVILQAERTHAGLDAAFFVTCWNKN